MPTVTTSSGLQIEDIIVGSGPTAASGQHVIVHYTGWLADGKKFDSSVDRNEPFRFVLDGRHVIPGWEEGVVGMNVAMAANCNTTHSGTLVPQTATCCPWRTSRASSPFAAS
jgi:FKBP-type peptidyl-prolyl cis-trans isomerase